MNCKNDTTEERQGVKSQKKIQICILLEAGEVGEV